MKRFIRVTLFVTEICNKVCHYCDIPLICQPKSINISLLENYFPTINSSTNFDWFTVTGGEPGTLDGSIWDFILSDLRHPIRVNTNGLFITNGMFDSFYDKINEIGYHPYIELSEARIEIPSDPKIIIYMPFHKRNYLELHNFLETHKDYRINLIPYIRKYYDKNDDKVLSVDELSYVKELINGYSNISQTSRLVISTLAENKKNLSYQARLACQNSNVRVVADFVRGRFSRCPESMTLTDSIIMDAASIGQVLEGSLFSSVKEIVDKACQTCVYYPFFISPILERYKQ